MSATGHTMIESPQRYSNNWGELEPNPAGDWIKYADYVRLREKIYQSAYDAGWKDRSAPKVCDKFLPSHTTDDCYVCGFNLNAHRTDDLVTERTTP